MTTNESTPTETDSETESSDSDEQPVPRPSLDPTTTRREVILLWDAVNCNPNGDPLTAEDRPRIDDTTQQALVSAQRLKRIVRDQLDRNGYPIFIAKSGAEHDRRDDKNDRFDVLRPLMNDYLAETVDELDPDDADDEQDQDLLDSDAIDRDTKEAAFLAIANDVRLFGDSMAFDQAKDAAYLSQRYTGAFQLELARSLNEVRVAHDGQTSVLSPSSEDQDNPGGNMYTSHRVPYALLCAHGVVNEHAARDTRLSDGDVERALDALWTGIHEQHSMSKSGQQPRLLLSVEFASGESHVGDLHREIELDPDGRDETALRDIEQAIVDVDSLLAALDRYSEQIDRVTGRVHRRIRVRANGDVGGPQTLLDAFDDRLGDEIAVEIERE